MIKLFESLIRIFPRRKVFEKTYHKPAKFAGKSTWDKVPISSPRKALFEANTVLRSWGGTPPQKKFL